MLVPIAQSSSDQRLQHSRSDSSWAPCGNRAATRAAFAAMRSECATAPGWRGSSKPHQYRRIPRSPPYAAATGRHEHPRLATTPLQARLGAQPGVARPEADVTAGGTLDRVLIGPCLRLALIDRLPSGGIAPTHPGNPGAFERRPSWREHQPGHLGRDHRRSRRLWPDRQANDIPVRRGLGLHGLRYSGIDRRWAGVDRQGAGVSF